MSKSIRTTSTSTVAEITAEYKAWRKEFNKRWDTLREKQRQEAAAYKEQFTAWQKELDEYITKRDKAIAKAEAKAAKKAQPKAKKAAKAQVAEEVQPTEKVAA